MTTYPYTVTTEQRTYNLIIGGEDFQNVRNTWNDQSKITSAWFWDSTTQKYVNQTTQVIQWNW